MVSILLGVIAGLVGGVAAGLQAPFAGLMGQRVGDLGSVFFTYVGGGLLITMITLLTGGSHLTAWRSVPWYAFLAGPLGLVIIASLSYTVPRLGAAAASTLFVAAWLILSLIFDQFGWLGVAQRSLDGVRWLGVAALLVGTWLVVR
ncbi:MAG: DMT family transporter [Anaerolineae bacterium]|nr:DMT family transporter [Anaerolineae bacterium]